jgi:hypothetical protein
MNYYRLPRKFEISLKYRFLSGNPYTDTKFTSNTFFIGATNKRRYTPYQTLDFKISKGITLFNKSGHFYIEIWNSMNDPNAILIDSETKRVKTGTANMPITFPFLGFDLKF